MKGKFDINLKKALNDLSELSHCEGLWQNIYDDLNFNDLLHKKASRLPLHTHNEDLWDKINLKIIRTSTRGINRKILISSAIAASFLIIIMLSLFNKSTHDDIAITHEYFIEESLTDISEKIIPIDLLNNWCENSVELCNTPLFKEKIDRLNNLDNEIVSLNAIIKRYGESPALVKSLIKMENEKAFLLNDLIKQLRS
jgi:hypothetical protein